MRPLNSSKNGNAPRRPVEPENSESESESITNATQPTEVQRSPPAPISSHSVFRYDPHASIDALMDPENRRLRLGIQAVSDKHGIQAELSDQLSVLEGFEIIIVCDDSGSMTTPVDRTGRTRWERLLEIVTIILDIGVIFDSNGVDIYFLNRSPILGVTDPVVVQEKFAIAPKGYTPLARTLQTIFQLPETRPEKEKNALVFVATDGFPTDEQGNDDLSGFEHVMNTIRRVNTTFVQFLLCTDDQASVAYLERWDNDMSHVDVTRDFEWERETVRKHRGSDFPFSPADYVVKAVLGAIHPHFDFLNEPAGGRC